MIRVLIGDMFKTENQTLVNTVNCVGVMGKGIAADFKKLFPWMYDEYARQCEEGTVQLGKLTLHRNLFENKTLINFPTKNHWKSPTVLRDIESGLDYFLEHYKEWGITSVAFPPLGCGNGGLSWSDVGPLMYEKLSNIDIPVEIYAPFGTPAKELTTEFLQEKRSNAKKRGSWMRGTLSIGEIAVLEVLYRLQNERYAIPIGRTMFQKASYILAQAGVDTGFIFTRSSYGPFSNEASHSLSIYANGNLTREEQIGNMFRLTVTENYEKLRNQFVHELSANKESIDKAVDLLSRIKDTEQGEEVATVIYAANTLALEHGDRVTKKDILEYILRWKKRWDDERKKDSIKETINNLEMLNWLNVSPA